MKTDLGPEYLHAEEFLIDGVWKEFPVEVKEVLAPNTVKSQDGKLIDKGILVVGKTKKRFVLGSTNERLVACALGSKKPLDWIGKKITLYPVRGDWFGQKNVCAIRVRVPDGMTRPFVQKKSLGEDITGKKQVSA